MAIKALLWTGVGAACWLWALPGALLRKGAPLPAGSGLLLVLWVLPALAFHALIHVGDPEHTLVSAPALSLLGAWVLSRWAGGSGRRLVLAGALAAGLSCALYFLPWPLSEHNHWKAKRAAQQVAGVVEPIRQKAAKQPVFVISWESAGLWRQVSYYLPESPVLILHGAPDNPGLEARHMFYCRRRRELLPVQGRRIFVPAGISVAIIPPAGWEPSLANELRLTYRQEEPVLFVDLRGESLRLGHSN